MWRKHDVEDGGSASEVDAERAALCEMRTEVASLRGEFAEFAVSLTGVSKSLTGLDGLPRAVGEARDRVLEAVGAESGAARDERQRAQEWREVVDAELAELKEEWKEGLKETGEAFRGRLGGESEAESVAESEDESEGKLGEHVEQGSGADGKGDRDGDSGGGEQRSDVRGRVREAAESLVLGRGAGGPVSGVSGQFRDGSRAEPRGGATDFGEDRDVAHGALLLTAATVSSARLVCHRDVWEFVAARAGSHAHFRRPSVSEQADAGRADTGRVAATLSGPSLIAVLVVLWDTWRAKDGSMDADWALAATTYARIRERLAEVEPGRSLAVVEIRLDDGVRQGVGAAEAEGGGEGEDAAAA